MKTTAPKNILLIEFNFRGLAFIDLSVYLANIYKINNMIINQIYNTNRLLIKDN